VREEASEGVHHVEGGRPRHSPIAALVVAMRPRQWIKSALVGVAPAAAGVAFHHVVLERTALCFVAFSLVSSGTYLLNDLRDVEADRGHPTKRARPIAAGELSPQLAGVAMVVLLACGLGLGTAVTWRLGVVLGLYVAQSVAYSLGAKRIAVIELGFVASGFVLRAIAGGVASGLPLSSWFLVVISFGALFVAVGKRLAEFHELGDTAEVHRAVLGTYTQGFLNSALTMCAAVTVTGYCLWAFAVDRNGLGLHHDQLWIQLSVAPVVLAVLYVLLQLDLGRGGTPEDLVLKDRTVQLLCVAWIVLVAVGVYR
jgi:decaprenyl-phosphate phosphoribosyltransferase